MSLETAKTELQAAIEKAKLIDAKTHLQNIEAQLREKELRRTQRNMLICEACLLLTVSSGIFYFTYPLIVSLFN